MAITDAGPYLEWIRAFDDWNLAEQRLAAASSQSDADLVDYLRRDRDMASEKYQQAIRNRKSRG